MKIIERIFDAQTGETIDVEREETKIEKEEREILEANIAKEKSLAEEKDAARQIIFDKLGITEEEAKVLLS